MAIKFLQEKETQEVIVYIVVFAIIISGLVYFVGVDFNFEQQEIVLEEKEDFFGIKATLDQIENRHDFARFRSFVLISPFGGAPGRPNPFHTDGVDIADDLPVTEEEDEGVLETPENMTEEDDEGILETPENMTEEENER